MRATPESINIFQNLFEFDPSDHAAAERYRSERMLQRRDYDEVLTSVARRATTVHGLRADLDRLLRRIGYHVRDVDYAGEVIPRLDEALAVVGEQVEAEERFADVVSEHAHHHAPDLPRLQRITGHLQSLIHALTALQRRASVVKQEYEAEQDRQLFTYRRVTINPQADLLAPLGDATPEQLIPLLQGPLTVWLGARAPRVLNLRVLVDRMAPAARRPARVRTGDPFDLGELCGEADDDPVLRAAVSAILQAVQPPVSLSETDQWPGTVRVRRRARPQAAAVAPVGARGGGRHRLRGDRPG